MLPSSLASPPPQVQLKCTKHVCWFFCLFFFSFSFLFLFFLLKIHHCSRSVEGFRSGSKGGDALKVQREVVGGVARGILAALDKKVVRPWLPPPPPHTPNLSHLPLPSQIPAFLTQLPAVMDDDMCHITSTCAHRGVEGGWVGGEGGFQLAACRLGPTGGLS